MTNFNWECRGCGAGNNGVVCEYCGNNRPAPPPGAAATETRQTDKKSGLKKIYQSLGLDSDEAGTLADMLGGGMFEGLDDWFS